MFIVEENFPSELIEDCDKLYTRISVEKYGFADSIPFGSQFVAPLSLSSLFYNCLTRADDFEVEKEFLLNKIKEVDCADEIIKISLNPVLEQI